MTSHDVVDAVRRLTGLRRVGHAGTLDPGAAGVLLVCVGQATRFAQHLQGREKRYRAEMVLGVRTDTQDAAGRTTSVAEAFEIPWREVESALMGMVGTITQRPPMASAVRVRGRRLYQLAREGVQLEQRPERTVVIYDLRVLETWPPGSQAATLGSRVLFDVTCSAGTYVRTLCADAGDRLGCGAHLGFLVRTAVGPFRVEESATLEELQQAAAQRRLAEYVLPVDAALDHLPAVRLDGEALRRAVHGTAVPWPGEAAPPAGLEAGRFVRLYDQQGRFRGVARLEQEGPSLRLQPDRLLQPESP